MLFFTRQLTVLLIPVLIFSSGLCFAEESLDQLAEVARLKQRIVVLERGQARSSVSGDAAILTSMKKNAAITIGGEMTVEVVTLSRDDGNTAQGDSDTINSTRFSTGQPHGAYLDFKMIASPDVFLFIKLDLDDSWNTVTGQDDLVEQAYFRWNKINGSNWDLVFGKRNIDYGQDRDLGLTRSFHDGWVEWLTGMEEANLDDVDPVTGLPNNPHASVGTNSLPFQQRDIFLIEGVYHYKDLLNVYLTLFQNNIGSTGGAGRLTRGMHEDRSDDTLFFQSFAGKIEMTPTEGLIMQASVVNYHNASAGDRDTSPAGSKATADATAISLGFDYTSLSLPINIWGEYQHGFNWTYNDDVDTDTLSLGVLWDVTEAIDLGIMGEWAEIDDALGYEDENYWQIVMNGKYTFTSGVYLMMEYSHVWYKGDRTTGNDVRSNADVIGLKMGWVF